MMWGGGFKDGYQRIDAMYRDVQPAGTPPLSGGGDTASLVCYCVTLCVGIRKRGTRVRGAGLTSFSFGSVVEHSGLAGWLFPYAKAELSSSL